MRGKAWKSTAYLLGVAQPRLKGTTFRLVLTLRTSVGRPRMANPAVSLLSFDSDLVVTISLRFCWC
jgi:hypothetical protein